MSSGSSYFARMPCDGDGRRVKRVDNFGTIHYVGAHYERNVGTGADTTETITKFYHAQLGNMSRLIAFKKGGTLYYVAPDYLGSTLRVVDTSGNTIDDIRYHAFGGTRAGGTNTPTDRRFTGQTLDASTGLYWYGSRAYDPVLGRFWQPHSIVPDYRKPQALNRYSYVLNNPVNYTDPTGNRPIYGDDGGEGESIDGARGDEGGDGDDGGETGAAEGLGFADRYILAHGGTPPSSGTIGDWPEPFCGPDYSGPPPSIIQSTGVSAGATVTLNRQVDLFQETEDYWDVNVSFGTPLFVGGTGGVMMKSNPVEGGADVYFYGGGGFVTPGPGASVMSGASSPSEGLNVAGQVALVAGGQGGYSFKDRAKWGEFGAGTPGASAVADWVLPRMHVPPLR